MNVKIPKDYPESMPKFMFPQEPYHPSIIKDIICCGITNELKKNWDDSQNIAYLAEIYCKNIAKIPNILKS